MGAGWAWVFFFLVAWSRVSFYLFEGPRPLERLIQILMFSRLIENFASILLFIYVISGAHIGFCVTQEFDSPLTITSHAACGELEITNLTLFQGFNS